MSGTGASARSSVTWNVVKTTVFLVAFWSLFLFAIPIGIAIIEIELGIQRFPPMPRTASALLLVGTLVVLWSALRLAVKGEGTPLPVDPTRELVTSGPYAFVRHPFVSGAVAQIVAIGIGLGSVPVLAYAAIAMTVWYYGIRPGEERLLEQRFGTRVLEYRRRVRGFRPF